MTSSPQLVTNYFYKTKNNKKLMAETKKSSPVKKTEDKSVTNSKATVKKVEKKSKPKKDKRIKKLIKLQQKKQLLKKLIQKIKK